MSNNVLAREDVIHQNYVEYNEKIKEFYSLKKQYDTKLTDYKKTIKKLSLAEKKEKLANFKSKRKCINCNKIGGTNFIIKGNHLEVKCGSLIEPCDLNISIDKPEHYFIPDIIAETKNSIEEIKQLITLYKLDLLFEMENEDVIISEFKSLKDDLDTQTQVLKNFNIIDSVLNEQVSLAELFIPEQLLENNRDEIKDDISPDQFNRTRLLDSLIKYVNGEISQVKQLIVRYKKTEEDNNEISDVIEKYKFIIKPCLESIRKLQYSTTYLETHKISGGKKGSKLMPIYHFKPTKYNIYNKIYSHVE